MKSGSYILKYKFATFLVILLSLNSALLATQPVAQPVQANTQEESNDTQGEHNDENQLTLTQAIYSSVQVSIDFSSNLMAIVPADMATIPSVAVIDQISIGQYKCVRILLRKFISPNAP